MGPSREFLLQERQRALAETPTEDCRESECFDCGACGSGDLVPILDISPAAVPGPSAEASAKADKASRKLRLRLSKTGPAVHYSHLEFKEILFRALRRAGWPLVHSKGFHPQPKASFGPACPVGVESLAELVDVTVSAAPDPQALLSGLSSSLPEGIGLLEGNLLGEGTSRIMKQAAAVRYRMHPVNPVDSEPAAQGISELMQRERWKVTRTVKGKTKTVDVRPSLLRCEMESAGGQPGVVCDLSLTTGSAARPQELAREIFGESVEVRVVREDILFREDG
jgi:radical SAM-linked protein